MTKEREQIYILDGDIPFLAQRAQLEANFTMEAKAHIQLFHQYFFNLPPDNDYIKWTVGKAMYMADGTALKQKQALDENGFYSDIISSSAVCTIMCDSIQFDEHERKFTYYGTQLIKRRTRDLKRSMVTTGYIESVPRTRNNPHGLMITNWRTLENKDLTQLIKRRTRDLKRSMVTTGYIESVPRTRNNPHGLMITNWRTLENKDLDY